MKILRTKVEAAEVVVDQVQAAEAGDRADEVAAADLTTATTARKSANTGRSEARIRHTKGGNPRKGEKEEAEDKEDKKE